MLFVVTGFPVHRSGAASLVGIIAGSVSPPPAHIVLLGKIIHAPPLSMSSVRTPSSKEDATTGMCVSGVVAMQKRKVVDLRPAKRQYSTTAVNGWGLAKRVR